MDVEYRLKEHICQVGRRLYARGFVAGTDGNISARLDGNRVVCTPTLVSKGFMAPADICTVDMSAQQLAGIRQRSSEVLLHLQVYQANPAVHAVVHCHPPHATAFSLTNLHLPSGILPEVEIFLGPVPTTTYETPGTERFARTVLPLMGTATAILLKNHGVLTFGGDLELACHRAEILEAYCRILLIARQFGSIDRLPGDKIRELLDVRQRLGLGSSAAPRDDGDLYVNPDFGRSDAR